MFFTCVFSSAGLSPVAELRHPVKCPPRVVDSFVSNGHSEDVDSAESFIKQAMEIIMDEAVKKATDVHEKVKNSSGSPSVCFGLTLNGEMCVFLLTRCVSGVPQKS